MIRTLSIALLAALIAASPAAAHTPPGTPNPACNASENPHDYVGAADTGVVGFITVTDGCVSASSATDGEYEFGYGGAFLPASHHSDTVCVTDLVVASVSFVVGSDVNGDGIVSAATGDNLATGAGCVTAGFAAGADGGWWVFLAAPATAGHIWA